MLVRVYRALTVGIAILAVIAASGIGTGVKAQSVDERDVKAAFILKLVNFVQWPGDGRNELVIGFVGADATGDALQRLASGRSVNGKALIIRHLGPEDDLKACQVVFVGAAERKDTPAVLERLRGASVLTVGEADGFGQHGGIVNLLLNQGHIRIEVNSHAAERAHLQISSRVLSLATIVSD